VRQKRQLSAFGLCAAALAASLGLAAATAARAAEPFLPLPAQARPALDSAQGYRLQRAGPSAYVVIAGIYQAAFVVTRAGVVLIDAPPAMTYALKAAIASVTSRKVAFVILSHDHYDHIGGVTAFPGARLVAHADTAKLLQIYPDPRRPAPSTTFSGEGRTLRIGGETFQLIYPGPSHEAGNIIVYVPRDRLVVMTDELVPGWAPYHGWGDADYIPGYFKAFDSLLKLDFETYVGGHLYRTGTRQDVLDARAYMIDLWSWTKAEAAATPQRPPTEPANAWATQTAWFDAIADRVTARLVEKWSGRLAGVDTFTHGTVIAALVSILTDDPVVPDELLR
jgi:glyoxylase-like metal-dependent hydrolase (beta-lactamase superfamily II)